MKYSSLIRQIIVDLVKAKNPVPKQFRKYHKGGKYRGERGAPFDDIRESVSHISDQDREIDELFNIVYDPEASGRMRAANRLREIIKTNMQESADKYFNTHFGKESLHDIKYDSNHPYYNEHIEDDFKISDYMSGSDLNTAIKGIMDSDELGSYEAIKNIIIPHYIKMETGIHSPFERDSYNLSRTVNEKLINSLMEYVQKSNKIISTTINEFQQDCDKLSIPNIRSTVMISDGEGLASSGPIAALTEGILCIDPIFLMLQDPDLKFETWTKKKKPPLVAYYSNSREEYIRATIWHELGHQIVRYYTSGEDGQPGDTNMRKTQLQKVMSDHCNEALDEVFKSLDESDRPDFKPSYDWKDMIDKKESVIKQMAPSDYGSKDPNELFAESFAAHKMGWDKYIHPKFKELFERLDI